MFCITCSKELTESAQFCSACGTAVSTFQVERASSSAGRSLRRIGSACLWISVAIFLMSLLTCAGGFLVGIDSVLGSSSEEDVASVAAWSIGLGVGAFILAITGAVLKAIGSGMSNR